LTTLADNTGGGISVNTGASNKEANLVVLNSILANNGATGITTNDPTPTIDFNDVIGHLVDFDGNASQGPNGVSVAPLFVDPASGDYRLLSTSPLLDAGTDLGIIVDLLGNTRPDGAGFAIGAFEVGVAPQVVPEAASIAIWSLLGLGLAGFGCCRKRRKK